MKGITRKVEPSIELSLKDSEIRYRRLFEAAQDGILILDARTGMIEDVNPYLIKMLGYSRKEFIKKKLWEVGAFKDIEASRDAFEVLQKKKYIRYKDLPLRTKDGRLIQVEFVSNVYLVGNEKVIQCNIRDITKHKEAERSVAESEKRFRALIENSSDAITLLDSNGIAIYDSPAAPGMLGYAPADWIGQDVFALIHPDDLPRVRDLFQNLVTTPGAHVNSTFRLRHKSGSWLWIEAVATNLLAEPGVKAIVLNYRDITEHKRIEDALRKNEAELKEAQRVGQFGSWDWDSKTDTITWSEEYCRIYGFNSKQHPPGYEEHLKAYTPESAARLDAAVKKSMETGAPYELDLEQSRPDGTRGWVTARSEIKRDANGQIIGLRGTAQDITERKQAEKLQDTVYRIAQAADQVGSLEALYPTIHSIIREVMVADNFYIALYDEKNDLLSFPYSIDEVDPPVLPKKPGKGLTEYVLRAAKSVLCDEALYEGLIQRGEIELVGVNSQIWLGVPLIVAGKAIGVMAVQDYKNARAYGERERHMLEFVSSQVALAIERKRAEDALRESEVKFRNLFNNAEVGMFRTRLDGSEILDVNERYLEIFGRTRAEMQGSASMIYWADPREREEMVRRLEAEGRVTDFECGMLTKQGEVRRCLTSLYLYRAQGILEGSIIDITERKHAEEALRESEERYRQLFENSPVGIYRTTPDGRILVSNPALVKMLGFSSFEELSARNLEKGDADATYARNSFKEQVEREDRITGLEAEWRKRDGTPIFVRENAQVIRDGSGAVLYYEGTIEDITERKRAEEALRNSEIKLRSLFAAMVDVIIVYDADGRYLEIAPTDPTDLYLPLDETLGRTVTEVFPPDQASFFLEHIRQTLKSGQRTNAEYSLSMGGKVRWFSASVSPLSSNSVIWVAHDITHRKAGEQRIRRQLEHLTALSTIDRVITSNFDLKLSLSEILMHVTTELEVDAADILILNSNSQMLEYAVGRGFQGRAVEHTRFRLGEGLAGRAALERSMIQHPDFAASGDVFVQAELLAAENVAAYFAVPLIAKGEVRGVLEVFHRSTLKPDPEWLNFLEALAGQAAIAIENATLFDGLQRSNLELTLAYDATIEGWSHALDLRDKETEGHTLRVTEMTIKLARAFGLSEAELVQVRWGALLHDIGKMGVPDGILFKPDPLTDEEWVVMKKHPTFAYEMLAPIRYLRLALDIPYCHHEKWDGSGYPRGLKGDHIPLVARIFAVVDVWDALNSDRPYRPAWAEEKVREHIRASSGTHFDPQVVDVFMQIPEMASDT